MKKARTSSAIAKPNPAFLLSTALYGRIRLIGVLGLSSVENNSAGEVNAREKVSRGLVVACGDGTKVLEFIEEALERLCSR